MKEGVALRQLADVLPPPAPGLGEWLPIIFVAAIVTAAVLFWWLRRQRSPRGNASAREARQRLGRLRVEWQARGVNDREAAYRLAALLRLGLRLPQLAPLLCPPMVKEGVAWEETLRELHALRYRRGTPSLSPQCFDRVEQWLAAAQRAAR
jgi:hypothetical protein